MAAFYGQSQASLKSVGMSRRISVFQDKKWDYEVTNPLADHPTEFSPEDELINSISCAEITTEAINLQPLANAHPVSNTRHVSGIHASHNALLNFYDSNMESLGWQDIINLIMIEQEQVTATLDSPSVGDRDATGRITKEDHTPGDGKNHQTVVDKRHCIDNRLSSTVMNGNFSSDSETEVPRCIEHTAQEKMKKRKADQDVSDSTVQKGPLKMCKRVMCKSSLCWNGSKDHTENSNPKLDISWGDPAKLLPNYVEEEPNADSQKDYIHVRARRGQATDRHSLAERARREKIRECMKKLQNLVPGCNKITSRALVLDEIINYVQSLQKQVGILSIKLNSVVSL